MRPISLPNVSVSAIAMHTRHLNEQMVRVLKTIGYDIGFCRGEGQYLYDRQGNPAFPRIGSTIKAATVFE